MHRQTPLPLLSVQQILQQARTLHLDIRPAAHLKIVCHSVRSCSHCLTPYLDMHHHLSAWYYMHLVINLIATVLEFLEQYICFIQNLIIPD